MSDAEKMAEQGWAEVATERARVIRDIKSALRSSEAECERLRERVRVLEEALRRISRESQDNLLAAIADDALGCGTRETGAALKGSNG